MTRNMFRNMAGVFILLFALLVCGAGAATNGYIVVGIAPLAQFDAYYAFSTLPTTVKFVDSSLGSSPFTYLWNFGDGATSTEQNPTHIYTQRGTYTVSLTVKNAYGTSTEIKRDYISIGVNPKADFSATPTTGNAPMTVRFTDQSQGGPKKWTWIFGDGQGSSDQNPVHTYWTAGIYNVILTVSNDYGTSDITKNSYIVVVAPLTSQYTADPMTGSSPLTVRFTDKSLGNPATWYWNFGDGITSTEQFPSHTFTAPGAYDVMLTVARDTNSDTSTQVINVGGVPVADFAGNPTAVNIGGTVRFTDQSANKPTSWQWNFGDGATSTDQNPAHVFLAKGLYTVTLTVRNDNGRDSEIKKDYINVGVGPVADFIPQIPPYELANLPQNVRFIDKSTGTPTSWFWDFGDGQTSTVQNPSHSYATEGSYSVSLTVKNNFGMNTKVMKDIINVGKGPMVDFEADKTVVGVGRIVTFTDLSRNAPTSWTWDFGDGTTGTGAKPDHAYRAIGTYDVTLTASNPTTTSSRTKTGYITVLNLPRADFTADKTRGGAPMSVQFTDMSSGMPTAWKWDFGDGAGSTERNPLHTYSTFGTYSVSLTISNANGEDTTIKPNYVVTTLAPVADFRVDKRTGKAPFIVQFKDLSTNNPTKWVWEFGDGTSSYEQNPQHLYPQEGTYDVRLTVSNNYGSDTAFKTGSPSETSMMTVTTAPVTVPVSEGTMVAGAVDSPVSTMVPPPTQAPVLPGIAVIGTFIGMLIMNASRKN